jgi:hypothetical protein
LDPRRVPSRKVADAGGEANDHTRSGRHVAPVCSQAG